MSDHSALQKALEQLTKILQQPVVPVRDANGNIIAAQRVAPKQEEDPSGFTDEAWTKAWDGYYQLAQEKKLSAAEIVLLMRGIATQVRANLRANRDRIATLESKIEALKVVVNDAEK